jgi:LPXTG-motif cell wall-anchored protein
MACAVAAAALGLPSSAWAQGAGDEQYSDPFGDEQEQGGGQSGQEPEETPAPSGPDTSTSSQEPAPAPAAPVAQNAGAESSQQLPRTGANAGLLALGGTLLLAGGFALRVRLRES